MALFLLTLVETTGIVLVASAFFFYLLYPILDLLLIFSRPQSADFLFANLIPIELAMIFLSVGVLALAIRGAPRRILGMMGALPVPTGELANIRRSLEEMRIAAGLSEHPSMWIIESDSVNAAVVGLSPRDSRIVLTTGLLELLNKKETDAIVAHLVARIASGDMMFGTMRAAMVAALPKVSAESAEDNRYLALLFGLERIAVFGSRGRSRASLEKADLGALFLLKDPDALLAGLKKIADHDNSVPGVGVAIGSLFVSWPCFGESWFFNDHDTSRVERIVALRHEPLPD